MEYLKVHLKNKHRYCKKFNYSRGSRQAGENRSDEDEDEDDNEESEDDDDDDNEGRRVDDEVDEDDNVDNDEMENVWAPPPLGVFWLCGGAWG